MTQEMTLRDVAQIVLSYAQLAIPYTPELDGLIEAYEIAQTLVKHEAHRQGAMPYHERFVACPFEESIMAESVTDPEQLAFWRERPGASVKLRDDLDALYSQVCQEMNAAKRRVYDYIVAHFDSIQLVPKS